MLSRNRKRAPFKAKWATTVVGLARELKALRAKSINLHIAVPEHRIVQDGTRPHADARADHPGVVLAFDSKHGPLHYSVDTFTHWQDNVRAIVLTLENLRAIERYGTVKQNQQYRGFRALPDHGAEPAMTVEQAARWFVGQQCGISAPASLIESPDCVREAYRVLAQRMHPDKPGGNQQLFAMLAEAKRVLDQHHKRSRAS